LDHPATILAQSVPVPVASLWLKPGFASESVVAHRVFVWRLSVLVAITVLALGDPASANPALVLTKLRQRPQLFSRQYGFLQDAGGLRDLSRSAFPVAQSDR
jgi:hypothetical protein